MMKRGRRHHPEFQRSGRCPVVRRGSKGTSDAANRIRDWIHAVPGKYSFKFVVYDWNSGRVGTYQTAFVIPNLSKEAQDLPISSVVLSNELIALENALPNSMQFRSFSADAQLATDPLVIEGKKLIPAVTRVFGKRRDLIVFLHAYEPTATTTEPLTAFVTLYRGQTKVFENYHLLLRILWVKRCGPCLCKCACG